MADDKKASTPSNPFEGATFNTSAINALSTKANQALPKLNGTARHPLAHDELAYSLGMGMGMGMGMGNCSLRQTIPCIRYAWMRLRKSSPTATVGSFYQHSRTHPTIPRQPEQQAALPGYRAELPQSEADIRAFDAAVRQLIEPTVQLLMDDIQGVKAMK